MLKSAPLIVKVVCQSGLSFFCNSWFFISQEATYLEACIENHTKSNLYMDQVEFEPAPFWSAIVLKADEQPADDLSG